MLNISKNSVVDKIDFQKYNSAKKVTNKAHYKYFNRFIYIFLGLFVIVLFLPWTQNIQSDGYVTTLDIEKRPQYIPSPFNASIEKWFIREGDLVQKGDTLVKLAEIKSEYLDRDLIFRTQEQLLNKEASLENSILKKVSLEKQLIALKEEARIKLSQNSNKIEQYRLKVNSDSLKAIASETAFETAKSQFNRTDTLFKQGLQSRNDWENKNLKYRKESAEVQAAVNALAQSRSGLQIEKSEFDRLTATYQDKTAKTEATLFETQANINNKQAEVNKLRNTLANYERRSDMLYVKASQNGIVNLGVKSGIGETVKPGDYLVRLMPSDYTMAIETFITPMDLPLVHLGEKVRVLFDGWPSIVFSGWENLSYGTYPAEVVAIANNISPNGKYRVLLAEVKDEKVWPKQIGVGSGAKSIALLQDVPIWYELWRQLNGFPANYYKPDMKSENNELEKVRK